MGNNIWLPLCRPDDEKIKIVSGDRIYLTDVRGKTYIDANSGLWNVPLGYSNPDIKSYITAQLDKISYVNACEFSNEQASELADMLRQMHHDKIDKIAFTCTGSESVELAIKLIRKYASMGEKPFKRDIAIIQNSYHGSYYGSMSCSSYDAQEREGYAPLVEGIRELSVPFCNCWEFNSVTENGAGELQERLDRELELYEESLGGIVIEPILGSAGVIPLPGWYLKRLTDFAHERDILIVFDEVATGFGRTGSMFYYQQYGFQPDIVTMSKGINNGILPLGAVAVSEKVTDRFREKGELLFHLSTKNGNALSCAAGVATMKEYLRNDKAILKQVKNLASYFRKNFEKKIKSEFSEIFDIRGKGLMFAVELADKDTGIRIPQAKLLKIVELLKKNGVVLEWSYIENVTSCLVLFLPFIIHECEIDQLLEKMRKVFRRVLN